MSRETNVNFLLALFPAWPRGVFAEIRTFKDGSPAGSQWVRSVNDLLDRALRLNADREVFYGVNLRRGHKGKKQDVACVGALHVDLDVAAKDALTTLAAFPLPPSAVVGSGWGAHAYWLLREPFLIEGAEDIARLEALTRGLAYTLPGADRGAWDLSRVLRPPGTKSHKRGGAAVEVLEFHPDRRYEPSDFEEYGLDVPEQVEAAVFSEEAADAKAALAKAEEGGLPQRVRDLIHDGPAAGSDRSEKDWAVLCALVRAGLSDDEICAVFREFPIGEKYSEPQNGDRYLGMSLAKARRTVAGGAERQGREEERQAQEEEEKWEGLGVVSAENTNGSEPSADLEAEGQESVPEEAAPAPSAPPAWEPVALAAEHYVPRYVAYARSRTDAPPQYHEALALIQLSAAVGPHVRIPLASKPAGMLCNLWLLMLGDSTLYRKSTSEDLAVDLLRAIEPDMFLANDQSPQGFIEEMSYRDGKAALWHRDEFRSFLAQIKNAAWMAGGKELLMKLFDGASYHRRLRTKKVKGEAIPDEARVEKPYLVTIAAGVTTRIIDVLTVDDVIDGFLPRFLVVMPTVLPPRRKAETITESIEGERGSLIEELRCLQTGFAERGECSAQFEPAAWKRWNDYAAQIEAQAGRSTTPELSGPIAGRIADNTLKLATLLQAAADGAPSRSSNLHVPLSMMEAAIEMCERFRKDAEDLAMQIGSSSDERRLTRFIEMVKRQPGIGRSDVARALKLNKRQMDDLEATANDRDLVRFSNKNTKGRAAKVYWQAPAGEAPERPKLSTPTEVR